ncbi:uncharacterized protein LOC106074020 [Biomphalaria glabrata]|uniref:Uncharacterized protein LOC106074020 n=1 Tax=Biomphalaria glabrata TaxID=6526 RepID=A0A9W2ZWH8_BIOGL|nr:uncharacterized protein LOC106074020 [Biomphalaria glabrata]XP_013090196.2 uncharacterized protein LOC106074020 [Biomphalaria glabrata]XP_055879313.1 uncharacterized protein LOC106074020 [Biomphalaria glabrata]XP_055879315.1 uncharacterized protein LOC106074020 [Biomphalaria glabrata]XP_055879316.1 uncharacterized protein LOC106074020 [Biomphalaria glabrata]
MKPLLEILKHYYIQKILIYGFTFLCSFLVIVPLGDLKIKFTDEHCSRCLLYSDFDFNVNNTPQATYFKIRFGEQEVCEYSLAVSSVFCLIYPVIAVLLYIYLYRRDNSKTDENKLDLSHGLYVIHIITELCVAILILVSAGLITSGFRHICDSLDAAVTLKLIDSCSGAQSFADWRNYDGSNFYVSLSVATAGCWLLFVSWLLQSLLGLWKLWWLNVLPVFPCCRPSE